MGLLLFYLFLALGISFLCSILEAVILSTTSSFISMKEKQGIKSGQLLHHLKTNIDKPISAILSLNTVAHTLGAAGVGAQAVELFGNAYFGIISAILTFLILVLSEIIPKTIGAVYWKQLALPAARVIRVLIFICYPLVLLSELITKVFTKKRSEATLSREELSAIVETAGNEGVFNSKENKVIQNLMKLDYVTVKEVMTPRIVTITADENETLEEFFSDKSFRPYSRIPIYEEHPENITGYVLSKEVLEQLSEDKLYIKLIDIKREIMIVNEDQSISYTWERMLEHKEHIALVVNEYGTFEGIITMEDVVETIFGLEIMDEKDTVPDMQKLAREKWNERMNKYKHISNTTSKEKRE